MYDSFVFRGQHTSAFGALAFFGEGYTLGAKIRRSEYPLPGGGVVEIGEESYGTITRTVELIPADGAEDTPSWRRRLLGWLQGGRGDLILDEDPEVILTASFDQEGTGGLKVSPLGGVQLKATIWSLARSAVPVLRSETTVDHQLSLTWKGTGIVPAPVTAHILPTDGTLTSARITVERDGKDPKIFDCAGLSLTEDQELTYRAGDGQTPSAVLENGTLTFAHVRRWAHLAVLPGDRVTLETAGSEVRMDIEARERMIVC